jgi:type IV pilus assembly protein PilV
MKSNLQRRSGPAGSQGGFSMIEVLVSLLLIAVAMLGQAGMQANALKFSKGASFRMQAVLLANEVGERMESNKAGAIAGNYVIATASGTPTAAGTDCLTAACSATDLTTFDLAQWTTRVAATLPSGTWQILRSVTGNPSTYQIVLTWQDRRSNANQTTYSTTGTTETLSLTTTKYVYQ